MAVVALFDSETPVPAQCRWALLFARARQAPATLLLPPAGEAARQKVLAQVRDVVGRSAAFRMADDAAAAPDAPTAGDEPGAAASGDPPPAARVPVTCRFLEAPDRAVDAVIEAIADPEPDLVLLLCRRIDPRDQRLAEVGRALATRVPCQLAAVQLGDAEATPLRSILVPASRRPATRPALRCARELGRADDAEVLAVYVEPDIGRDAEPVGRHVVDRVVHQALGNDRDGTRTLVVIAADVEAGIDRACAQWSPDLVLIGAAGHSALTGRFAGTIAGRLCRRLPQQPIVVLRDALPLGNRLRRGLEVLLQRYVPQLDRETRVDLAERVQSSSAWNFDFVALISLATLIASMGLLQDSAAVIIGAMLVAPLMTPILGLGLALAHGNTMLARLALRAIGFGVGTALLLALLVGLCRGDASPTSEMVRRGWPGLMDLFVAFVSGLAAAYATSRPGLVAALPGVAIAASLVPPLATSGLAASTGEFHLAYGAFLLFFTNMVAIVLAAGFSLWAVGIRSVKGAVAPLRHLGNALLVLTLVLAVHLNQRTPHRGAVRVPDGCAAALAAGLPEGLRLVAVAAEQDEAVVAVTVRVGGADRPAAELADQLLEVAAGWFPGQVRVRLVHEWEAVTGTRRPN